MMLKTEERNLKTMHIDKMDTLSMLEVINEENMNAVNAVGDALCIIAKVCDAVSDRIERGGRLFYIGAGTSGRIGVIDAAECPPTFGVSNDTVIGIIAGGEKCMISAAEGEEDDKESGVEDIKKYNINENDTMIGISASGGAQYVVGALEYARDKGAYTVSLSSNSETAVQRAAEISIVADTGSEVITGSTRMKAGTAQKLILNMISTVSMIRTGKVYENMMINLKPSNIKLKNRVINILSEILKCDEEMSEALLEKNNWDIRKAAERYKKL